MGKAGAPKYGDAEAVSLGGLRLPPTGQQRMAGQGQAERAAAVAVDSKTNMAEKQSLGQILLTFYRSDAYAHIWY